MGMFVISYIMDYKGDPYIFRGYLNLPIENSIDHHYYTNPMDYKEDNMRVILRSKNEKNGIEFSWSIWLYLDAAQMYRDAKKTSVNKSLLYHIFNKGGHVSNKNAYVAKASSKKERSNNSVLSGMSLMTCPGLYLKHSKVSSSYYEQMYRDRLVNNYQDDSKNDPYGLDDDKLLDENDMLMDGKSIFDPDVNRNMYEYVITMNTMNPDNAMETIAIPNIPLNVWTHIVIRCINHKVDVYINGRIKKRTVLSAMPRQNYGDIYVAEKYENEVGDDGVLYPELKGKISDLRYFNYALQARAIEYYTEKGPNVKPVKKSRLNEMGRPYYLTQRWHYTDYLR
tara:strand:- start:284 stop:1297 length:1014 start_codon:yes stop_codon:yes gene_type:complete